MKSKIITIIFLALIISVKSNAQSNLENVLSQISKNNKKLQANTQYWESQKVKFKTGNTPDDPKIEYDFLSGSPASTGVQHDLTLIQEFDFPTVYVKKAELAKTQIAQSDFAINAERQNILLEAKQICIELVYLHKLQIHLQQLKVNTAKMQRDFQSKMDKGDGNILDVNKAKLQLIEINKEFQENISAISQLNTKLTELNGGNIIVFNDTSYQAEITMPEFTQLEKEFENADPVRKNLEQQKLITQKQLALSKAQWLPKIDVGYHYQGILGATFHGFHSGISIPLWQNKNTVKLQKTTLIFDDLNLQSHRNEHYSVIKQLYEKYSNLKITLEDYQSVFATLNNTMLLNKAFSLGQISTIEYFMEMNYYIIAFKNYLKTEKDYQAVIAELYKYQL